MRKKFPLLENELENLYCSELLTTYEIAKLTGFSQRAVHYWMKKYGIEGRKNSESHCKRVKIGLSPTLAYVLGVCYGDGSVHKVWCKHLGRYRYEVKLNVRNRTLAESFKKALEELGFKTRLYCYDAWWKLFANSKIFYNYFHSLTLLDLKFIFDDEEMARSFIRGFYESEGTFCLCFDYKHDRFNKLLGMYNTNPEILKLIKEYLKKCGLDFRFYQGRRRGKWRVVYALVTGRRDQINHFLSIISPSIKNIPTNKQIAQVIRWVMERGLGKSYSLENISSCLESPR